MKSKSVRRILICVLAMLVIGICGGNYKKVNAAEPNIECSYSPKEGILTVKGTGVLKYSDIKKCVKSPQYKVVEIIVEEGVTGIENECVFAM